LLLYLYVQEQYDRFRQEALGITHATEAKKAAASLAAAKSVEAEQEADAIFKVRFFRKSAQKRKSREAPDTFNVVWLMGVGGMNMSSVLMAWKQRVLTKNNATRAGDCGR
jgi:hypothetical protein